MDNVSFTWDERKNRENRRKHGISFEEAQTVFFDDIAVEFYDDEHSEWEDRFLLLGRSARLRVLMICFCKRSDGEVLRIISARRATTREQQFYPGRKP